MRSRRAAAYQGHQQLAIKDLAGPTPVSRQVVVEVEFCAICGTGVHAVMYDIAPVGSAPFLEGAGALPVVTTRLPPSTSLSKALACL